VGDRNLDELRNIIVQSMGDFFGFEPKFVQLDGIATSVAVDEGETRIAVGLADGRIAILDTDGRRLATYNASGGDNSPVRALRFEEPVAGELATIISVSQSGRVVRQSQSAKAEVLEQLDLNGIRTAQFDARGQWLVAHDDRSVEVWDVETWTLEFHARPDVSDSLTTACLSSDGRYLVAGYSTENPEQCGFVRWELPTGERLQKDNVDHSVTTPHGACFSHDGRYLAFGCTKLLIYDAHTLQPAFSPISFDVQAVATSSDGRYLASYNYQGEIEIRDASTFQPLAVCSSPANMSSQGAFDLYFAPGGGRLIASHANSLRVWDLNAAPERKRLIGHQEKIGTVTFSHGGTWVASASHDGTVRVWNAENGIPVRAPFNVGSRVHCVAFSSGDRYLAAATWDEPMIYVWSSGDWQSVGTLKHNLGDVTTLCFHPERNQLVASGADGLAIWNLIETGDQVELHLVDLEPERRALHAVTSRHGESIAWVGGNEKSVRIRDWQAGASRKLGGGAAIMLDAWHGLAFYPDGERLIFLGANGRLEIWDVRANRIQRTVDECGEFHLPLVACSPDGKWLLTKTDRRNVVIWNTESWEQSIVLPAERAGVDTVAWHPHSNQIAIGTSDGLISLWNLSMIRDELKTLRLVAE
jgi:WD40 repeat protein